MAIELDNLTVFGTIGWPHECSPDATLLIHCRYSGPYEEPGTTHPIWNGGVTYGGVPLVFMAQEDIIFEAQPYSSACQVWALQDPPPGIHDLEFDDDTHAEYAFTASFKGGVYEVRGAGAQVGAGSTEDLGGFMQPLFYAVSDFIDCYLIGAVMHMEVVVLGFEDPALTHLADFATEISPSLPGWIYTLNPDDLLDRDDVQGHVDIFLELADPDIPAAHTYGFPAIVVGPRPVVTPPVETIVRRARMVQIIG